MASTNLKTLPFTKGLDHAASIVVRILLFLRPLARRCGKAQERDPFSPAALMQAPITEWRTNGGSLSNQRYSPLAALNSSNIAGLKGVWHTRLRGSGNGPQYSGEAQPLVDDGVAYIVTGADDVFAVSIDSGDILWQYTASLPPAMTTVCCSWTSRGVGLSEEHVYVGQLDGQLKALDRASESWNQGNILWLHGGAPVWNTPAVDPQLGLMYFSTGNAGADSNGAHRAGDNLFTSSILALDVKTGQYRWHFQQVHHDIWGYDAPNPVMLFDIDIDGVSRKALTQAGKTGWFYILDRITGAPLLGIDEKPVPQEARQATAATQPFPRGDAFVPQSLRVPPEGVTLVNEGRIFTPYWTDAVAIAPGAGGGANWPPSAHDPRTGYSYVCASDRPFLYAGIDISDEPPKPGDRYTAGVFLGEAM